MTHATENSDAQLDHGLQPWQFFLLGGMLAATATVIVATGQSPANIIILSLTVVSVSFVGLGVYRIAGAAGLRIGLTSPLTIGGRTRVALEREKALVLRSIKELEFDFAMGKIAKADFDEMSRPPARPRAGADASARCRRRLSTSRSRARLRRRLATAGAGAEDATVRRRRDRGLCRAAGRRTIPTRSSARTAERSCEVGTCARACASASVSLCFVGSGGDARRSRCPIRSAMAGTPLPAPELPTGTVTVRVVRERMGNNIAGQAVTLTVGNGTTHDRQTDAQGRAQFDGLAAGRDRCRRRRRSMARR